MVDPGQVIPTVLPVPPHFVFRIHGYSFQRMPELGWSFGYPVVIGSMVALCGFLYTRFKRAGWI